MKKMDVPESGLILEVSASKPVSPNKKNESFNDFIAEWQIVNSEISKNSVSIEKTEMHLEFHENFR